MHNKLLYKVHVHVQATSLLKGNKHWNAFRLWYMRNNLVHFGGYTTNRDVADTQISFIFI